MKVECVEEHLDFCTKLKVIFRIKKLVRSPEGGTNISKQHEYRKTYVQQRNLTLPRFSLVVSEQI